jgi:hypothetical protein
MHSHSRFYYVHFVAGSKNTPDAAHRALTTEKAQLEKEHNKLRLEMVKEAIEGHRLDDITLGPTETVQFAALVAARVEKQSSEIEKMEKEILFIEKLLSIIEKHSEYPDIPREEAYERCQRQESLLEILTNAENMVLTMGGVPPDALMKFRLHPDFAPVIMPAINEMMQMQRSKHGFPIHGMTKWMGSVIRELSTDYPELEAPSNLLVAEKSIVGPDGRPAC